MKKEQYCLMMILIIGTFISLSFTQTKYDSCTRTASLNFEDGSSYTITVTEPTCSKANIALLNALDELERAMQ